MADTIIKSVNLLPEFLQTAKNTKFLSSTIDQLIQKPQLERLDAYIGSTNTPTYTTSDIYIPEISDLRTNYQLTPSLVLYDSAGNISSNIVAIDDLINEINLYGGDTSNLDRLFRSKFYSYNPHIDWDKLINYQQYYWLTEGPETILITDNIDIDTVVVGQVSYVTQSGLSLSNGMKVKFESPSTVVAYQNKEFFVEGVGTSIKLIDYKLLNVTEIISTEYIDSFDISPFDEYPFDNDSYLPLTPNYIVINRASADLNPWSRYNRWVHQDVISASAKANGQIPVFDASLRAYRPIIEFEAGIQLYNFGSTGIPNIDLIDTKTKFIFDTVEGSAGHYVDGILLQEGNRVIFTADTDPDIKNKIYQVHFANINNKLTLTLQEVYSPMVGDSLGVNYGTKYRGTSWWFNGNNWTYSQQLAQPNQSPLFDLFDNQGISYGNNNHYLSDFIGNQLFGYGVGSGVSDPILGFPLKYKNNLNAVASYLFDNYFMIGSISITENNQILNTIPTSAAYFKIGDQYFNVWEEAADYPIPLLTSNLTAITSTYYALPLGLTNNPLNGPIKSFTISDLSNHVSGMVSNTSTGFVGLFPGESNLRDLPDISNLGNRLISNLNPMPYSQLFIGTKENSLIDALTKAADQYNQFKMSFLRKILDLDIQIDPITAVDTALAELNVNKTSRSPYYLSDMAAYGTDYISKTWTVISSGGTKYPIFSPFDITKLSLRSILVYLNGNQLIYGQDYTFVSNDSYIEILIPLSAGDTLIINDYTDTEGNYIPPTPTKLGLYPKFIPSIFVDDTYITPTTVIQGHDGSIMTAYNDYRDNIILEFEKRIYNNIKAQYRAELFDINLVLPGAFRNSDYTIDEINQIIQRDFIKWSNYYGIDPTKNNSFDEADPFTWNYTGSYNTNLNQNLIGSWRAVYKYFYDTDRPHTNPWEMLGFYEEPNWWVSQYGSSPYTSNNTTLWSDLEQGLIRQGARAGVDLLYSRPGLSSLIPVDNLGNLLDPTEIPLTVNPTPYSIRETWLFGDQGSGETAWRRSSYWPFVVQKMLALTRPATYSALMYDPININKNIADQWVYGPNNQFLNLTKMPVQGLNGTLTSGYSVYVSEVGRQRTENYNQELSTNLINLNINLSYKVGGFVNNSELVIIDAIDPTSTSPGSLLQPEDYNLILNVSNPIKTSSISGVIVQKNNGKFLVKGYDTQQPYFTIYNPIRNSNTPTRNVGGVSESFLEWAPSTTGGGTALTADQTTTANAAVVGNFYQQGQIVKYNGKFYRVLISNRSEATFNSNYFQLLTTLPITGGATVQIAASFDKSNILKINYGTEFDNVQQVYDLIIGYGEWLVDQGFSFTEFNNDLQSTLDWNYTAKEFLYWTTQNWADQSVIALSPFADQITFQLPFSVVDNVFDSFYEYSLLQANGVAYPKKDISVTRDNGLCTIQTLNPYAGIYFARLNSVQKEHAIVFNNSTIFNDTIYDIETGYRQERMKVVGFRTANWNGDYFSPGFVYDQALISDWQTYATYKISQVVRYNGQYYSANQNIIGSQTFDFTQWDLLGSKPVAALLPNFDYKISQFEDFYSLDIDNFDSNVQKTAQNLIGYTPRPYLNNIFTNPISQYKFYQGFIREKGTKNAVTKLARASIQTLQGEVDYTEEWAFRSGYYGSYSTYNEIEIPLIEGSLVDNPQVISFVDSVVSTLTNDLIQLVLPADLSIKPTNYQTTATFVTTPSTDILELNFAGYPRLDDVNLTAFNQKDILNLTATNFINEGNVIWLANNSMNDWDVLQYKLSTARITSVSNVTGKLNFSTDTVHNLSPGQIISVIEVDTGVDGVYQISEVPAVDQFTVINTLSNFSFAGTIQLNNFGLIFEFDSTRYNSFDSLPNDKELRNRKENSKIWVDDDGNGNWAVYQKIKNYKENGIISNNTGTLGWSVSKTGRSNLFLVGSPEFTDSLNYGNVFVYTEFPYFARGDFRYGINQESSQYYRSSNPTGFGRQVAYSRTVFSSSTYGLLFVGAPLTSNVLTSSTFVSGNLNLATPIGMPSNINEQGLVKISSINPTRFREVTQQVLASPYPNDHEHFGSSIYEASFFNGTLLLVGAPITINTGKGAVYSYWITPNVINTSTIDVSYLGTVSNPYITTTSTQGIQWGNSIAGSLDANTIAVGSPGFDQRSGLVSIFKGTATTLIQTLLGPFGNRSDFGNTISVSSRGDYIFVTAPNARDLDQSYGKVAVYYKINDVFTLTQIISNPVSGAGMKFGQSIDVNDDATELAISALGNNNHIVDTFDVYTVPLSNSLNLYGTVYVNDANSPLNDSSTTFDSDSTTFFDRIAYSGVVYVYNRKNNLFKIADEIPPFDTNVGTNFGFSLSINNNSIYVGAPAYKSTSTVDTNKGAFYQYYKIDTSAESWKLLRNQEDLVDINTLKKVTLIDTYNDEVIDYLDIIDPIKGKIAGIAEQELKYKTSFDPAIYSLGNSNTGNNLNTNWLDTHVGELWWDLSTVKYIWYEQGELEYRKSNWGTIFPGSSIDIYEWVGTTLLPSQWAAQADTVNGLAQGISGQPKYTDNSVLSVKQVYNPISDTFTNYYYYWVKNSIIVPNAVNRRISSYQVSQLILNPKSNGLRYISPLSKNSVAVANIGGLPVANNIHLNISADVINNNIPKHTEWMLIEEGSENSMPGLLLEKKLVDSLLGHDSLGNLVPDPNLSDRMAYGIEIRPRQSMFKDRLAALRNIVDFANSVLINTRVTGNYNFKNLNAQEEPPDEASHAYDEVVEDNLDLSFINTNKFITAELSCTVENGKIVSIQVINPGFGYQISPTVTVVKDTSGAIISTEIDSLGRVITAIIVNGGENFVTAPVLTVRPYTVIVLSDNTYNGKWTKFVWETDTKSWVRIHTQQYNTPLYWNYVDWVDPTYNQFLNYSYTVNELYEVNELTLSPGEYVKVKNAGLGYYIVLEKTADGIFGTFDQNFNIVYAENGTIQISNSIWNLDLRNYSYDYKNTYDQTLYDQSPDLELQYLLAALKNDIFVDALKVNWNLLFFKAVKYALSEQKILDWAFKTSFINVTNYAGNLGQPPIYKLLDSLSYEDYILEVKPYHTQIRNFTTNYTVLEPSNSFITDFDLPSTYDSTSSRFIVVDENNPLINQYPWKAWKDNHTYQVGNIIVSYPGYQYQSVPKVVITTDPTDTGSGATAVARVVSGVVTDIEVTNPGQGYKVTPTVTLIGGGITEPYFAARAAAILTNQTVRKNTIGIKFDRFTRSAEVENLQITDRFLCDGLTNEFTLNWLAQPDKSLITVTLNGTKVLGSDYSLVNYSKQYGYITTVPKRKYNKIVLNITPQGGSIVTVTYLKNLNLLPAIDRILNYYTATSGMPGLDLGQLMTGITYPKTNIQALAFDYNTSWDSSFGYGVQPWGEELSSYFRTTSTFYSMIFGTSTEIIVASVSGISIGQQVNVISTSTDLFTPNNVGVQPQVISVNTSSNVITINTTTIKTIPAGSTFEFWNYSDLSILDSAIVGGDLSYTIALGENPSDIIIDGDGFITANTSYGPEELIPGEINESIGINVYTKNRGGAPTIVSSTIDVFASSDQNTTKRLSILLSNTASIIVSFEGTIFNYNTNTNFTTNTQFSINWSNNEIIIPPQPISGKLAYSIVSIGNVPYDSKLGYIDSNSITFVNTSFGQVSSLADINAVGSAYVTVNGQSIPAITDISNYGYILTVTNTVTNFRAAVDVYNLNPTINNTVSAWFFGANYPYFNKINEQIISINSLPAVLSYTELPNSVTPFNLSPQPGNILPAIANVIVEFTDSSTGITRILVPPHIDYYQVVDTNRTFVINNTDSNGNIINFSNLIAINGDNVQYIVRVYINGSVLPYYVPETFDINYTVNGNTVTISAGVANIGDAIAIVSKPIDPTNPGLQNFEYDIVGEPIPGVVSNLPMKLVLCAPPTGLGYYGWNTNWSGTIKVITYTDHDSLLMQTYTFNGNTAGWYKINRPVLDENYIWVTINGIPLANFVDFEILDDQVTVQISNKFVVSPTDKVVIITFGDVVLAEKVLGFRIFKDLFDRTSYKRLSKRNTTFLTSPLNYNDVEIFVDNASILTGPIAEKNIPGVVIISGERIEFFTISGNVLGQLRRGTLGTSPKPFNEVNTKVVDQSYEQNIPYAGDIANVQNILTSGTNIYTISTITQTLNYNTNTLNTTTFINDGILFTTIPQGSSIGYADQIEVYYGGRLLNKRQTYHQDTNISNDNPFVYVQTFSLDYLFQLPPKQYSSLGNTFLVRYPDSGPLNQYWVYQDSNAVGSVNGYVFSGVTALPSEFSAGYDIKGNQYISLNIAEGVQEGIRLTIVQKQYRASDIWNNIINTSTTLSLVDSTTAEAKFLQERPAELPEIYYLGGPPSSYYDTGTLFSNNNSPVLTDNTGYPLTDQTGDPLEGTT